MTTPPVAGSLAGEYEGAWCDQLVCVLGDRCVWTALVVTLFAMACTGTRYRVPLEANPKARQALSCVRECKERENEAHWRCLETCPSMRVERGRYCGLRDRMPHAWCTERWGTMYTPAVAREPIADKSPYTGNVHYNELRAAVGFGSSNSASPTRYTASGIAAFIVSYVRREGSRLLGFTWAAQGNPFGPAHKYYGATAGLAIGESDAHVEVMAELGVHTLGGMGQGLFGPLLVEGKDDAVLAYGGVQARAVFDVRGPNGLQLELSLHARGDFKQKRRTLVLDDSFLSPPNIYTEEWNVGGFAVTWMFGLSYQF